MDASLRDHDALPGGFRENKAPLMAGNRGERQAGNFPVWQHVEMGKFIYKAAQAGAKHDPPLRTVLFPQSGGEFSCLKLVSGFHAADSRDVSFFSKK